MASNISGNVPAAGSSLASQPIRTQFTHARDEISQLQTDVQALQQSGGGGPSGPAAANTVTVNPQVRGASNAQAALQALDIAIESSGGGNGVTWPITGNVSRFNPVLNIANGGTNAGTAGAALDNLSGQSGAAQGYLRRASGGAWSLDTPSTGGDGGPAVSWPLPGNESRFNPALSVLNGGTGAGAGNGALDNLSSSSGSATGFLQRSSSGAWSLATPAALQILQASNESDAMTQSQDNPGTLFFWT